MDNSIPPLYEEIDLRPYIEALLKQWPWILAVPIVASLVVYGLTQFLPATYEAAALVAVTRPRFSLGEFGAAADPATPFRAFPTLAMSDQIIEELFVSLSTLPEGVENPDQLKEVLSAQNGTDPSLIILTAELENPALAAEVVNRWASLFLDSANFVFGNQGDETVAFFENQMRQSEANLALAEEKLIAFQAINRTRSLSNKINSLSSDQLAYQADLRQIDSTLQEVRFLKEQIAAGDPIGNTANALAALLLQTKTLNLDANETLQGGQGVQFQLLLSDLDLSGEQQLAILTNLEILLDQKKGTIEQTLLTIEQDMTAAQGALQQDEAEYNRLVDARDISRETFQTLSRRVEEAKISSQEAAAPVQLASFATVPNEPSGFSPFMQGLLAGVIAFVGFVGLSFLRLWWQQGRPG